MLLTGVEIIKMLYLVSLTDTEGNEYLGVTVTKPSKETVFKEAMKYSSLFKEEHKDISEYELGVINSNNSLYVIDELLKFFVNHRQPRYIIDK